MMHKLTEDAVRERDCQIFIRPHENLIIWM